LVETVNLVFPEDANPKGTIFGGRVLQWVDMAGAMAAQRHCRQMVVTAVMDAVMFRAPIFVGEYAVIRAWVNRAWHTSMEVEVRVEAEAPLTGERRLSVEAYVTFVAVDAADQPTPVPPLAPQTPDEILRFQAAETRRKARMALRRS
jgi:acyl-CoA hydrolase